jgi:hypothetical protein
MCPLCPFTTRARYDTRPVPSSWQHLDFGTATVVVFAHLRRIDCPEHGVLVEAVRPRPSPWTWERRRPHMRRSRVWTEK